MSAIMHYYFICYSVQLLSSIRYPTKMWGLFSSLPKPYKKLNEPSTEGWCNRLHYRVTVLFFLGCSILVTCLEWVGNGSKISCVMEGTHMRFDSNGLTILILKLFCLLLLFFRTCGFLDHPSECNQYLLLCFKDFHIA